MADLTEKFDGVVTISVEGIVPTLTEEGARYISDGRVKKGANIGYFRVNNTPLVLVGLERNGKANGVGVYFHLTSYVANGDSPNLRSLEMGTIPESEQQQIAANLANIPVKADFNYTNHRLQPVR